MSLFFFRGCVFDLSLSLSPSLGPHVAPCLRPASMVLVLLSSVDRSWRGTGYHDFPRISPLHGNRHIGRRQSVACQSVSSVILFSRPPLVTEWKMKSVAGGGGGGERE